jgi:UDP-N-acetylglucosamine/UDP-N-acetylgalactosamine diphosphorylase
VHVISYINKRGIHFLFKISHLFFYFLVKRNFAIWEVVREDEFSPLKNSNDSKKDSPETCKQDLMALHYKWLNASGAQMKIK